MIFILICFFTSISSLGHKFSFDVGTISFNFIFFKKKRKEKKGDKNSGLSYASGFNAHRQWSDVYSGLRKQREANSSRTRQVEVENILHRLSLAMKANLPLRERRGRP